MKWLKVLDGQMVGLDTAPLIYFMEANKRYEPFLEGFFKALLQGSFTVVTSNITLMEVLVHPFEQEETKLADTYQHILKGTPDLMLMPITHEIAEQAAHLRATYRFLRGLDAFQVATALQTGADYFLTNDAKLRRILEIEVLVLDDLLEKA